MQAWEKLRCLYKRHIHSIVMDSFGSIMMPVIHWMEKNSLQLYAYQVSGVTFGELFWPRSHIDPDAWYTVLVCLDVGNGIVGGGDFAFAQAGWVLKCEHGDVLVYNGMHLHGTTEMAVNDASDGRIFVAFYMNKATLHARAMTMNMPVRQPYMHYD